MNICYLPRADLQDKFINQPAASLEFIMLITGALDANDEQLLRSYLKESIRILKDGGILFVQGTPELLPTLGVFLDETPNITFKYWFVVESTLLETTRLPSRHAAVMLFTKGNGRFNIKRTRLPHHYCRACERTLKDWGGKAHLMHPEGYVISDVIKDIPAANNYNQMSKPLFDLLIGMLDFYPQPDGQPDQLASASSPREVSGLVAPLAGLPWQNKVLAEAPLQYSLPRFLQPLPGQKAANPPQTAPARYLEDDLFDVIHQGDAIEILKQYPAESIDLAFADPPYNLDKDYTLYADGQANQQYIAWCNTWLTEYIRILKPAGSLFLLNLPRWALYHADFLNRQLYFQNWIAWDALSEPRGKIMPAHYALLFYTKQPTHFTFNYDAVSPIDARHYCLRAACIRQRKQAGDDDKVGLHDIWWDIHRIKHRRDRDYHPCQLPESLMERIIELSTNPGDVVLDAFGGTGTAPAVALQLGRRYVAIDLDPNYVKIMQEKVAQIKLQGQVQRQSIKQSSRSVTKKALQLELRQLSMELGRLPTPEDVKEKSQYDLELFFETFPTWGKALKAAKQEMQP